MRGPARRRPAGLRPRGRGACVLRPSPGRRNRGLRRARHAGAGASGPLGRTGDPRWNLRHARAHRPSQGGRHRRPRRLGGRRRDRGSLPGRALPRPVRTRDRARSSPSSSWSSSPPSAGSGATSDIRDRRPLPAARERRRSRARDRAAQRARCRTARSPTRSRRLLDGAGETLDVVNPYVTDRGMIRRIEQAARRGVRVRLFVPANANNWACAAAQQFHHAKLLDAGVRILEYPTMLHAKAFVRDGEELLGGNVQPRSLEPQALLRDRPPASVASTRGAVRRAVQRARRIGVHARSAAHGREGAGEGRPLQRPVALALSRMVGIRAIPEFAHNERS